MNRAAVLLIVLLFRPAYAQPVATDAFDAGMISRDYAAALAFMEPRILNAVPVSVLTVWGLGGLTALDPNLVAEQREGRILLFSAGTRLTEEAAPRQNIPDEWAAAAVQLSNVAAAASTSVRRAGSQGIVQSFFDELFNHLDPYSRYVAPNEAVQDRASRNGASGIGATLIEHNGTILVQTAVSDGPAALAGLHPGDIVIAVDGETVRGKGVDFVSGLVAGPEDTQVQLTWRNHEGRVRSAELTRAVVPPETVFSQRVDGVLLVRILGFDVTTATHLSEALRAAVARPHPPHGIVLDLRGNRGGLLREAVEAASVLLAPGVVAYTAGRDPDSNHIWRSGEGELAKGLPVAVLVDGRTASAAEAFSAALADRGRAVVIGSTTLGKGLVQTIDPLPDGGELFVTWSRILAPRGWPIQGLGLMPQVCTSRGEASLQHQLTALGEGVQPMAAAIEKHRAARAPLDPGEIVALRNPCPAAEGRGADLEAARVLIENPAAYAAALLPPLRDAEAVTLPAH